MAIEDIIKLVRLITLFLLFCAVVIYLIDRVRNSGIKDDSIILSTILRQINLLDNKINKLLKEIDSLKQQRNQLKLQAQEYAKLKKELQDNNLIFGDNQSPLLLAIGSDSRLQLDLPSLRAVKAETGLEFNVIQDATLKKIKQHLDRARINERPITKVHLSVHSDATGIILGGEIIDGVELSRIMSDVEILVIAGCESDTIGDYLGIVKYVITMTDKVNSIDASLFTRAFWTEIGRGEDPGSALQLALLHSPSGMSEFVERHF